MHKEYGKIFHSITLIRSIEDLPANGWLFIVWEPEGYILWHGTHLWGSRKDLRSFYNFKFKMDLQDMEYRVICLDNRQISKYKVFK